MEGRLLTPPLRPGAGLTARRHTVRSRSGRCRHGGTMSGAALDRGRRMLNKVPEVTLYFWTIKILCTTVGETASDYLSEKVGLGLTNTTFITGGLLIAALVLQFR